MPWPMIDLRARRFTGSGKASFHAMEEDKGRERSRGVNLSPVGGVGDEIGSFVFEPEGT